ncbi:MAG: aminoacyl-tRNA hydrolase [Planctomycetaceae bacterium]|jgi:PTH1 family peptidyl-tRNA hydrolase|nr:aminoacyl-tRNA hydrolase [Planctomycetaceae bacterium]
MKLIVGLGNPGAKYRNTRHNAGFMVLAEYAKQHAAGEKPQAKFHGELVRFPARNGETICLLAPSTFMNRSGISVAEAVQFYKIPLPDILIVCDDLNLPFGKLRFRSGGSSGGQKGLADILRAAGTEDVPRLRIGIGSPPGQMDAADYVLMNFTEKEQTDWDVTVKLAADAVDCWIDKGLAEAGNLFNGR